MVLVVLVCLEGGLKGNGWVEVSLVNNPAFI